SAAGRAQRATAMATGHRATDPAENRHNGPWGLWLQTQSAPSAANIRPSWAVTNAPVIRNVANATVQKTNTDGPAACNPAELMMNSTIATKITTRSNGPSVLATRTDAIFSEIIRSSVCVAISTPSDGGGEGSRDRVAPTPKPHLWTSRNSGPDAR